MLYVSVARGDVFTLGWHVGEKPPLLPWDVPQVISVQADGDELDSINYHLPALPLVHPVTMFLGKDAKAIAGKLLC